MSGAAQETSLSDTGQTEKPSLFSDIRQRLFNLPTLLCAATILAALAPGRMATRTKMYSPSAFIAATAFAWAFFQAKFSKKDERQAAKDVGSIVLGFLALWEAVTSKLDLLPFVFVPAPENVFFVYIKDYRLILSGFLRSLFLLLSGFGASLLAGISLGIAVGWTLRLRKAIFPIAKAISTVPAMIYGPYLVVMMPTFTSASIFVIFCGTFWSLFMNMINRVGTIDQRIVNTARILNVKTRVMLFSVILPYTLPRILNELTVSLSISVMTLTVAEMIGADRGMGFYVKRSLDYANYTQAFAGIFFIAVVITLLNTFISLLKKKLVKWSY
ncbi:ABC transporter permease [Treponema endosymbiont of Eucomonympha sp.]|uniref:ABC transporter permease n=2 Tax=Treponema endosymbiont of Eucomonympha sp. TaxID=1580831 RepID=UPI000750EDD7|nr:ABC transporter permease subunit [Treponema endosymbiont of Eucomonympha sp.]